MHSHLFAKKRVAAAVSVALGVAGAAPVVAQQSASGDEPVIEEVIVTGIRSSLMRAMDTKRDSQGVVDAITAEDIGDFPDTNLAESLQRITGVSIDRERGEGKNVTVRGFGSDYNLVTLNGRQMPTHAGTGRSFDFADLASEGIASVEVYKTSRANIHTGGVGATINIKTTKPLEQPGLKAGGSVKGVHDQSTYDGNDYTPELSGFYSQTFMDDTIGIALSGSFQERHHGEAFANNTQWHERVTQRTPCSAEQQDCFQVNPANHVNAPDDGDTVALPQQIIYGLNEFERTRVNGQLTVQWKPIESLTATLDYTYVEFELDTRWNNMSVWFSPTGQSGTWTDGSFVSPLVYSETNNQPDRPMGAGIQASKNERESVGLNLAWDVMDNLRLNLDYHDSSADRTPNSPYGSSATLSMAAFGRQSASVDYSSEIPVTTIAMDDPLSPDDMRITGSVFASEWAEMDIEQTHLSGTFDLTDTITIGFGVVTTELDNFETSSNVQRNTWSANDASAHGSVTDLLRPASLKGIYDELSGGSRVNNNFFLFDMEAVARRAEELQRKGELAMPREIKDALDKAKELRDKAEMTGSAADIAAADAASVAAADAAGDCMTGFCADNTPNFGNQYEEESLAVYFQASYEGELLNRPFNLRAGIRYEETDVTARAEGQNYQRIEWRAANEFVAVRAPSNIVTNVEGDYSYTLPNIDFDIEVWDDLIFRASYSETISRPNFDNLRGNLSVGETLRVENSIHNASGSVGNPDLKPHESENLDFSLEWYYSEDSYVSVGYFDKEVVNFVTDLKQKGEMPFPGLYHPGAGSNSLYQVAVAELRTNPNDSHPTNADIREWIFTNRAGDPRVDATNGVITGMAPDGVAFFDIDSKANSNEDANVDGWELAWQHTLWDTGFGFIVNATFADGSATFDNASREAQFALPGLSDTRNLIAFYDKNGLQARLAYNWRDSYFTGGSTQPSYKEEYEQWDISISYDLGDIVSTWEGFGGMGGLVVFMEGINITDETVRNHARSSYQANWLGQTGPRYNFGFRYTY